MRIHVKDQEITTVEEWFRIAPPKGKERQWKPYRSARELAAAWCPPGGVPTVPSEIVQLLASHPLSANIDFASADIVPEMRVRIDNYPGEPRNADLGIACSSVDPSGAGNSQRVAISVEAKADEPFGQTVNAAVRAAESRRAGEKTSNGDLRARELLSAIFGGELRLNPELGLIRYQLLTATAGALALAREANAKLAILVFHEFSHAGDVHTKAAKLAKNGRDLDTFVSGISKEAWKGVPAGTLLGPVAIPGNDFLGVATALLIGKAVRSLS